MPKVDLVATLASGMEYLDQETMQWCCMGIDEDGEWVVVGKYAHHPNAEYRKEAQRTIWGRVIRGIPEVSGE